jgi:hypothetical protein
MIKMNPMKYLGGLAVALLLSACGGGSPESIAIGTPLPRPLFTTAPESLTVGTGSSSAFEIRGGSAPYVASSSNAGVAVSLVNGSVLTLGGVAQGTANIAIRDAAGLAVNVAVTVNNGASRPLFTEALSALTIAPGLTGVQTYRIGGGVGPYSATSDNTNVASVVLNGSSMVITGLAPGSANIRILDSSGEFVTINVTVSVNNGLPLFTTAPSNVIVAIGASPTYSVGGGSGTVYTATSSNAAVATASMTGSTLRVTGVSTGSAEVVVTDGVGTAGTINVLVAAPILAVTPNNATGIINDELVATITGGTPPFRVSVGNTLVAAANINPIKPNELLIKLQQVGSTVVTVLDANNQSVAYSANSNAATPGIRFSPNTVTISEFDTQPILFTVFGAAGSLNVFSSDVTKLIATISGNDVTVSTGTNGDRRVGADLDVTITVVDSTRATGVATIKIKNNDPPTTTTTTP